MTLPAFNSIDMHAEFNLMLPHLAKWVLLRRYDKRQKCSCRRHNDGDRADPSCVLCEGRGWPYYEIPIQTYDMSSAVFNSLNASEQQATFAQMQEAGKLFFIKASDRVSTSDEIAEIALDALGNIVTPIVRLGSYAINSVVDMRGDREGAIDYLMVFTLEQEGR